MLTRSRVGCSAAWRPCGSSLATTPAAWAWTSAGSYLRTGKSTGGRGRSRRHAAFRCAADQRPPVCLAHGVVSDRWERHERDQVRRDWRLGARPLGTSADAARCAFLWSPAGHSWRAVMRTTYLPSLSFADCSPRRKPRPPILPATRICACSLPPVPRCAAHGPRLLFGIGIAPSHSPSSRITRTRSTRSDGRLSDLVCAGSVSIHAGP
jgi:hypothetical protein